METQKSNPVVVALLILVLVFGSLWIWYPKMRERYDLAEKNLLREQTLLKTRKAAIRSIDSLYEHYEATRDAMPSFPEGSAVDTHWLPMMDNAAKENNVKIAQRSIKGEEIVGDVTELTIECRDWEGRLDSFVWFLYDLETRTDAMMDFRALTMKPSSKNPGILQGSFTLNCAYMREPISDAE
ncbi:MAG: hypothetical protein Q4C03_02875 [bacterium]|nr:hypothetical protein [bacterium]MDO5461931.1 hypothetical protein [bacterium]